MLSVSYTGKNAYSAGKTSGILRGGASRANRGYVMLYCGRVGGGDLKVKPLSTAWAEHGNIPFGTL